jgi:hypothetical protein
MQLRKLSKQVRSLQVFFKPPAPYKSYELWYHPTKYQINQLQYYVADVEPATGIEKTQTVVIRFINYATTPLADALFEEDKYVRVVGGKVFGQPPYDKYRIMGSLQETLIKPSQEY